jgi:hypothetical protein
LVSNLRYQSAERGPLLCVQVLLLVLAEQIQQVDVGSLRNIQIQVTESTALAFTSAGVGCPRLANSTEALNEATGGLLSRSD